MDSNVVGTYSNMIKRRLLKLVMELSMSKLDYSVNYKIVLIIVLIIVLKLDSNVIGIDSNILEPIIETSDGIKYE